MDGDRATAYSIEEDSDEDVARLWVSAREVLPDMCPLNTAKNNRYLKIKT
ncbi:hypothetical protein [Vulcanisaeta sp. JCM 16161]|nr:hypothetical protein [Vulcanisaeta sp. JCM 16161]